MLIAYPLAAFVMLYTPLVAAEKTAQRSVFPIETERYDRVLTVWNIDTFEGGAGSRADFLSDMSVTYGKTKGGKGTHFLVSARTEEGALVALKNGEKPDVISFGIGCPFAAEIVKSLPDVSFKGGYVGERCYAYPWCAGGYFEIKKTGENRLTDRLIVSQGKYNSPMLCGYGFGDKTFEIKEPMLAYTAFLSGGATLIGTQRDVNRLTGRKALFAAKPLTGFSDLVQYVGICAEDREDYSACLGFIEYLVSESVQKKLTKIGMTSVFFDVYSDGALSEYDFSENEYTVSPFTEIENVMEIRKDTKGGELPERVKNLLKHL